MQTQTDGVVNDYVTDFKRTQKRIDEVVDM